jgi:hypothetical protein
MGVVLAVGCLANLSYGQSVSITNPAARTNYAATSNISIQFYGVNFYSGVSALVEAKSGNTIVQSVYIPLNGSLIGSATLPPPGGNWPAGDIEITVKFTGVTYPGRLLSSKRLRSRYQSMFSEVPSL